MNDPVIIIPARLNSARLPRKLMLKETGKTVLQHTYEQCIQTKIRTVITSPDEEILHEAQKFGSEIILTSPGHLSGSSRVSEAMALLRVKPWLVINVQGDEPLIKPEALTFLLNKMQLANFPVGTLSTSLQFKELTNLNVVKVVKDDNHKALYFSRGFLAGSERHIGVYAFNYTVYHLLPELGHTRLAEKERLEQLTFLELGISIGSFYLKDAPEVSIDTQLDYDQFKEIYARNH